MSNPYTPYLVYGTVTSSANQAEPNAEIEITTSLGTISCTTNSNGIYVADLAQAGYSDGETVTVSTNDQYNNEESTDTFVVANDSYNLDISLSVRTQAQPTVNGFTSRVMLHNIGNEPVSKSNPLPIYSINDVVPSQWDYLSVTYTSGNPTTVVYKMGGSSGTTVATLTLTYDSDGCVSTVTRT